MQQSRWTVMFLALWLGGCSSPARAPTTPAVTAAENSATAEGSAAPGTCAPDDASTWDACDGQRVTLTGVVAKMVHQHPIVAVPAELTADGADSEQGYVDAAGVQVIVLTRAPITCAGEVVVDGVLHAVSLGDPDGDGSTRAKTGYSGWKLSGATVTCP